MINYMIYRFIIDVVRRLHDCYCFGEFHTETRHMVVGGWWWDRPYKGVHVTIKTISLDSVLRLIRRFCVPLYRENRRRGRSEKKTEIESPKAIRKYCDSSSGAASSLRREERTRVKARFWGKLISRSYMRYVRKTSKIIQLQFRTFLSETGTRD